MFSIMFDSLGKVTSKVFGPIYRSVGKSLYLKGNQIEGQFFSEDRLVPSLRNLTHDGASPSLQGAQFIAPNATIVGNVEVGYQSSVWYGATLIGTRGIKIGSNTVIQDRSHLSSQVKIGDNVFIGPNCIIQGSQIEDMSYVSMGATVRHAKIESGALVSAGAVIADNVVVKEGEIWAGNPGRFLRNLTPIEREILIEHLEEMKDLAVIHAEEAEKNPREVISDKTEPFQTTIFEDELKKMYNESQYGDDLPISELDEQFVERRTIMRETPTYFDSEKDYEPYDKNRGYMGEKFNLGVHHEAYSKIATKISNKQKFDTDNSSWTQPY